MSSVLACWGKTAPNGAFHPAVYHMIDVGQVADVLLDDASSPRILDAIRRPLSAFDRASLREWLPFVVAIHDIGKISPDFQRLAPDHHQRLIAAGISLSLPADAERHQHISAVVFQDELLPRLPWLEPIAVTAIDMLAGHHGEFAGALTRSRTRRSMIMSSNSQWRALRDSALDILLSVFPPPVEPSIATPPNVRAATAVLTGFAILSDWIGSDSYHFPPSAAIPLSDYVPISRTRARTAVAALGFDRARQPIVWAGFTSGFPEITSPRPIQSAIDALDAAIFATPSLVIIEAPTGEGKTEAAIALARRFAAAGGSDELYVALPTMATSNQMYRRVLQFLGSASDDAAPVKLVHGQAFLSEDAIVADALGDRLDPESPAYALPVWFSSRKRSLLAPFGVGTVDQAELAVLNARHYMLRLLGLAGKTVIIDEIHAYDTYMSTIIDHALTWLSILGSPVILLSATLPVVRHRQLAAAYLAGIGANLPEGMTAPLSPELYPLVAVYPGPIGTPLRISPPAANPARNLAIEIVPDLPPRDDALRLLDLVAQGGAVCRITNTVRRAQQIFAALQQLAPDDVDLRLLHARIPGDDRFDRESRIAELLGPSSRRSPLDRIIVVGTQVLEQSLDYDVDAMVTDHAPIDLLLQRAGRLQRHARPRPSAHTQPVLRVALAFAEDGRPRFGDAALIYEPWLLWTTWLALADRRDVRGNIALTLPSDYRPLIERAYASGLELAAASPFDDEMTEAHDRFELLRHRLAEAATLRLVPDPTRNVPISEGRHLSFEEDEEGGQSGWGFASTREGPPSINLIPLVTVPGGVAIFPDEPALTPATLDRDTQFRLLRRAIRVQHRAIVATLPAMVPDSLAWLQELPLLRHHVPLVLDADFTARPSVPVRLDPVLGLVIGEEDLV